MLIPCCSRKLRAVTGVGKIVASAFTGETDAAIGDKVDGVEWLRVGQLSRMLQFFREQKVQSVIMAGQIAPKNLFDLRPDWKALLLLANLKRRNAESIFTAIGDELKKSGMNMLPATTFLEQSLAPPGLIAGPKLSAARRRRRRVWLGDRKRNQSARYRTNRCGEKRNSARGRSVRRNQ